MHVDVKLREIAEELTELLSITSEASGFHKVPILS